MAVEGNIADFSVIDLLQLLHLTQKSGSLTIQSNAGKAQLTFNKGAINSATFPSSGIALGKVLLEMGALREDELEQAIASQRQPGTAVRPLGQILLDSGRIEAAVLTQALEKLIERVLIEVVAIGEGTFTFTSEAPQLWDGYQHTFSRVLNGINVNTQMLLLDVLRVYDEKNRSLTAAPGGVPGEGVELEVGDLEGDPDRGATPRDAAEPAVPGDDEVLSILEGPDPGRAARHDLGNHLVWVYSREETFKKQIGEIFGRAGIRVSLSDAEQDALQEIDGYTRENIRVVAVLDSPGGEASAQANQSMERMCHLLRTHNPEVPVIMVLDDRRPQSFKQAFKRGSCSAMFRPHDRSELDRYESGLQETAEILVDCVTALLTESGAREKKQSDVQGQFLFLRNKILEFHKRRALHEISMTFLGYMAERLARSIMFLVRPGDLLGLGSFGFEGSGQIDPKDIVKLTIPLPGASLLDRVIRQGSTFHGPTDDPLILQSIFQKFGPPANSRILLLPLRADNKTVLLCYGDFGAEQASLFQIEALEIIACLAGMAFENALLRKKLKQVDKDPQ